MTEFHIRFEWLGQEGGSAVDQATFARIEIEVANTLATELEDVLGKTVRPALHASAYDLAMWFAANWWRLRWEPETALPSVDWEMSHHLVSAAHGTVWPDLRIWSSGQTVSVIGLPTSGSAIEPVRYLRRVNERLRANAFEVGVDRFVDAVVGRVEAMVEEEMPLQQVWNQVMAERADPDVSAWRRLEAKLGYDPDEAPEDIVTALELAAEQTGVEAMEEVAVASGVEAPAQLATLMEALASKPQFHVPDVEVLREESSQIHFDPYRPWLRAVQTARRARAQWALDPGPIPTSRLADLFGLSEAVITEPDSGSTLPMPGGLRQDGGIRVALQRERVPNRRFALARLAADHLFGPASDRLLPATDGHTTRQKQQRAFAQELLCPYADLADYVGGRIGEEDVEAAAEYFDVSPVLVASTLKNNRHPGCW